MNKKQTFTRNQNAKKISGNKLKTIKYNQFYNKIKENNC